MEAKVNLVDLGNPFHKGGIFNHHILATFGFVTFLRSYSHMVLVGRGRLNGTSRGSITRKNLRFSFG